MRPEDLHEQDPNLLPYSVTEVQTGDGVLVHFELLTGADLTSLLGAEWTGAVFHSFWTRAATTPIGVLKLVTAGEDESSILGLLLPGTIKRRQGPLQDSLLETTPRHQQKRVDRGYRGVGRVLIARLIAESLLQGGQGAVTVRSRPAVQEFYRHLGFRRVPGTPYLMTLDAGQAAQLLADVLQQGFKPMEGSR